MTIENRCLTIALASLLFITPGALASTVYVADLTGAAEFPSNTSPASGTARVEYDDILHWLYVDITFAGLGSMTTATHIHCCVSPLSSLPTAGVAVTTPTLPGIPLGVTSGAYSTVLDLTNPASFSANFVTNHGGTLAAAEAALIASLDAGFAYLNIHTSGFPAGEIRGFLQPVPLPAALWLFGSGLLGLTGMARHMKAS